MQFLHDFGFISHLCCAYFGIFGIFSIGSDKCGSESQCLPFDEYIGLIRDFIDMRVSMRKEEGKETSIDKIIFTSEDPDLIKARLAYVKNESFPFNFIINDDDAGQQGGGNSKYFRLNDPDHIMLSTLISIKMQLHTKSIVMNACSNFHKLIIDLTLHDCGAHNYMEIYSQNRNPEYRLKCSLIGK